MKILVTGGAGFIGSNLCARLLKDGHSVIAVDNFYSGKKENVAELVGNKNFKLIEHDIVEPLYVEEKIEAVYNLACPASPVFYQANPIRTIKINTIGTINMLGLAKAHRAKFLQASTSEIYGGPDIHPQTENYHGNVNSFGPRACYDEGKRCAEALCFEYWKNHQVSIKVARIFNTYGPKMLPEDGRVVSNFIVQALRGEDLTIYGDGSQTRSFCYIDDLVSGLMALMESSDSVIGPINLGNPGEFTVKELAEKILELTGSKNKVIYKSLPIDDPKRRCPDISKAKQELNWEPKIDLENGLKKTITYFSHLI